MPKAVLLVEEESERVNDKASEMGFMREDREDEEKQAKHERIMMIRRKPRKGLCRRS